VASLREMRKRIGSVKSIRQITKAMKMVAAARLRKAQESILAARPYAKRIEEVLQDIATRHDLSDTPLLRPSMGEKILLVVITADKGLCGSFNTNILRQASRFLAANAGRKVDVITIGKKARDYFIRRGIQPRSTMVDIFRNLKLSYATDLRDLIVDPFLAGEVGEVHLIYNEFKSAMSQEVVVKQLLPVKEAELEGNVIKVDFEYEPNAHELFSSLLPTYFAVMLWTAFLESFSAEMGARMTSMESATKNASDMISKLTLVTNRIRQASITGEIAEIVGGAEALR